MKYIPLICLICLAFFSSCARPVDDYEWGIMAHLINTETGVSYQLDNTSSVLNVDMEDKSDPNNPFNHIGNSLKYRLYWEFGAENIKLTGGMIDVECRGVKTYEGRRYAEFDFKKEGAKRGLENLSFEDRFEQGGKNGKVYLSLKASPDKEDFQINFVYNVDDGSDKVRGTAEFSNIVCMDDYYLMNNFGLRYSHNIESAYGQLGYAVRQVYLVDEPWKIWQPHPEGGLRESFGKQEPAKNSYQQEAWEDIWRKIQPDQKAALRENIDLLKVTGVARSYNRALVKSQIEAFSERVVDSLYAGTQTPDHEVARAREVLSSPKMTYQLPSCVVASVFDYSITLGTPNIEVLNTEKAEAACESVLL